MNEEKNKTNFDFKEIVSEGFTDKIGVLYFIDVPANIDPSHHKEPTNKEPWSYWRKENYTFFEQELGKFPSEFIVVDLGAGELYFKDVLERFRFIAVDFYPYPGINVVCDLNKSLPFKDNSVDVLVLSNMLEHSAEPQILLAECYRVLKPGGVILGVVPFMINIHQRPYDYYRYTDINLYYLLEKHGFKDKEVVPVLMLSALVFSVTSNFFVHLIERTKYSLNAVSQKAHVFFFRVLWKIVRVAFRILNPLFVRCGTDEDLPLGYNFKAKK